MIPQRLIFPLLSVWEVALVGLALHVGAYFGAYFVMEKYLGSC